MPCVDCQKEVKGTFIRCFLCNKDYIFYKSTYFSLPLYARKFKNVAEYNEDYQICMNKKYKRHPMFNIKIKDMWGSRVGNKPNLDYKIEVKDCACTSFDGFDGDGCGENCNRERFI
jgi:hypothetical protein